MESKGEEGFYFLFFLIYIYFLLWEIKLFSKPINLAIFRQRVQMKWKDVFFSPSIWMENMTLQFSPR